MASTQIVLAQDWISSLYEKKANVSCKREFGPLRAQALYAIANILWEKPHLSQHQTEVKRAEGADSPLDVEEATTWYRWVGKIKNKTPRTARKGAKLRYLSQRHYRNVEAIARGKALSHSKGGRRVTLERDREGQAKMGK